MLTQNLGMLLNAAGVFTLKQQMASKRRGWEAGRAARMAAHREYMNSLPPGCRCPICGAEINELEEACSDSCAHQIDVVADRANERYYRSFE